MNSNTDGNGKQDFFAVFKGIRDPQRLKKLYHELAYRWHPDRGGDLEAMKSINMAYHSALKWADGYVRTGEDGKNHTYHYDRASEQEIIEKISQVLHSGITGITVELIGSWVWIGGNTKPHKDKLGKSGLGFMWHSTRSLWYWKPVGQKWHKKTGRYADMGSLRAAFGSRAYDIDARVPV